MEFTDGIERAGKAIDLAGVGVILAGALIVTAVYLWRMRGELSADDAYRGYRHGLGKAILLGLELLVAADIIRTVAASPTIQSVVVLGGIVLIRTFLSLSLQLEIEGRLPWQRTRPPLEEDHSFAYLSETEA